MRQPIKQLLAVAVVLGASSAARADTPRTLAKRPACGNAMGKGGPQSECEWQQALFHARSYVAGAEHELRLAVYVLEASPRVLANGRPACGNTMGKRANSCVEDVRRPFRDRAEAAAEHVDRVRTQLARTEADYARWKAARAPAEANVLASR